MQDVITPSHPVAIQYKDIIMLSHIHTPDEQLQQYEYQKVNSNL